MTANDPPADRSVGPSGDGDVDGALDIRRGLALLFGTLGVLLGGYGVATRADTELYVKSGYVNVNLRWGLVLLGFAAFMGLVSLLSTRARRRRDVDGPRRAEMAEAGAVHDRSSGQ